MIMKYQIKDIEGFPGYRIDTNGDMWSCRPLNGKGPFLKKWRKLKPVNVKGYQRVTLCRDGQRNPKKVHRLVLKAFVGPCPDGMEACHNNGDPADNRLENLRWDTPKNNSADRKKHGTHIGLRSGENHNASKLKQEEVDTIRYAWEHYDIRQWQLARMFGVARSTINSIVNNYNW